MKEEIPHRLDLTDIPARLPAGASPPPATYSPMKRAFLSVRFNCCNVYSRVYASADGTKYDGRCPKCMQTVRFVVGEGGTTERSFVVE